MDFDLIFQITSSPSQKADQMSHHGDIIKNKTKQKKKKSLPSFTRTCRMKEGQQKRLQLSRKNFKCELQIRINTNETLVQRR